MKQFLRAFLRILDGSPNTSMATRNRQRGQSMLELALITPLLAILIAGAVEVGWYTNHWLSLLEVTRVGARSATFLQNELGPLQWNDDASVAPAIQTEFMGVIAGDNTWNKAQNARDCDTYSNFGFYSFIACLTQSSLEPLELAVDLLDPLDASADESVESDPPSYDDLVVSVFSIQTVNNAKYVGTETNNEGVTNGRPIYRDFQTVPQTITPTTDLYKITYDLSNAGGFGAASNREYPPGRQNIVVGRYPATANECTHKGTYKEIANTDTVLLVDTDPGFEIDPFDYLDGDTGAVTGPQWAGVDYVLELTDTEGASLADSGAEFQRGFSFTGQHRIDDPNVFCYGSEFSVLDVEELINMPGFIQPDLYNGPDSADLNYQDWVDNEVYPSQDERMFFEPQGMTLVEVFWQHDLLLNFALFRPMQEAYADGGDIVISLWSAFPLPSVAPNILYQLP